MSSSEEVTSTNPQQIASEPLLDHNKICFCSQNNAIHSNVKYVYFLIIFWKLFLLFLIYLPFYCAPSQIENNFFFCWNVQMPCAELNESNASNAFFRWRFGRIEDAFLQLWNSCATDSRVFKKVSRPWRLVFLWALWKTRVFGEMMSNLGIYE